MAVRSRVQFSNVAGTAEVVILPDRSGCLVAFLLFWLTGWGGTGLVFIGALVLGKVAPAPPPPAGHAGSGSLSMLLLPLGWLLGVLFAVSQLVWMWRGREVLTVAGGGLRVQSLGGLFKSDKTYILAKLYHLRVRDNSDPANQGRHRRDTGAVLFGYEAGTVAIADDLPEAEARQVVEFLHRHRVDVRGPR